MISVVTPWRTLLSAFGLMGRVKSECVLMSIKPGATARPAASIVLFASPARFGPMLAMQPAVIATSPGTPALPLPSNNSPFRIRRSNIRSAFRRRRAVTLGRAASEPFFRLLGLDIGGAQNLFPAFRLGPDISVGVPRRAADRFIAQRSEFFRHFGRFHSLGNGAAELVHHVLR